MKWKTAVALARSCDDVTFLEWIDLYYGDPPTEMQKHLCCEVAYIILLRNDVIEPGVAFTS